MMYHKKLLTVKSRGELVENMGDGFSKNQGPTFCRGRQLGNLNVSGELDRKKWPVLASHLDILYEDDDDPVGSAQNYKEDGNREYVKKTKEGYYKAIISYSGRSPSAFFSLGYYLFGAGRCTVIQ